MKKLFLAAIINFPILAGFVPAMSSPVWAVSSCNSTATPSVLATNQTFSLSFPNLWPQDQQAASFVSYILNFDNIRGKQSIPISRVGARDGQATVSDGLPSGGTIPFTVVAVIPQSRGDTTACKDSVIIQSPAVQPPTGSTSHGGGFGPANLCKNGTPGVETDFGCIPSDPGKLVNTIFGIVLGFAGGLAVLFIIIGGFKIATSAGNPDSLEDGRHTITAAISGLVFILLATTILGIIGIDILNLGLFSRSGGNVIINR